MQTTLETQPRATRNASLRTSSFADVVERQVDMRFFENRFFDEASGCKKNGCQRISYCSCDCNHCSIQIL